MISYQLLELVAFPVHGIVIHGVALDRYFRRLRHAFSDIWIFGQKHRALIALCHMDRLVDIIVEGNRLECLDHAISLRHEFADRYINVHGVNVFIFIYFQTHRLDLTLFVFYFVKDVVLNVLIPGELDGDVMG